MGFQRKRKLYPLDFTGTDLEGLTVVMRGLSVQEYLDLSSLQDLVKEAESTKVLEETEALFYKVAGKIEKWNLEDENGNPIPPSKEELLSWDFADAMGAIEAWLNAVGNIPAPLEQKSNGGKKWVGPPIPMDIPSPNLPNS